MPFVRSLGAISLLCASTSGSCMTPVEAANNIMFLVAARNEGHFCRQFYPHTVESLMAWENKNSATFTKSTQTIENHAVATNAVTRSEASTVTVRLLMRLQKRDDEDLAPSRSRRTCSQYSDSLRHYESKLVR